MLSFALEYRKAITELTSNLQYDMRKYELDNSDWHLVEQLSSILKVSTYQISYAGRLYHASIIHRSSVMRHIFSHEMHLCSQRSYQPWI